MAPASVNVRVKAGPIYWDTPVINVTLSSSRIIVILPSVTVEILFRAGIATTFGHYRTWWGAGSLTRVQ
jgi:hypothetical protein